MRSDTNALFRSYCYGPADILQVCSWENRLELSLLDLDGAHTRAVYYGCVYRNLDRYDAGTHLSLVQKLSAEALLRRQDSPVLSLLRKNADDVEELVRGWESDGLSFYLHCGPFPQKEFLVAAERLEYRE